MRMRWRSGIELSRGGIVGPDAPPPQGLGDTWQPVPNGGPDRLGWESCARAATRRPRPHAGVNCGILPLRRRASARPHGTHGTAVDESGMLVATGDSEIDDEVVFGLIDTGGR